jgi:magnesium-transporting ATPase (P-type)
MTDLTSLCGGCRSWISAHLVGPVTYEDRQDHHHLAVQEVVLLLETDPERGLSHVEAEARLGAVGPNVLPRARRHGPVIRFLLQLNNPLLYILIASGAATALIGQAVDASVIFGVVIVNAIVGFVQEAGAERALYALRSMVRTEATVVRDGGDGWMWLWGL